MGIEEHYYFDEEDEVFVCKFCEAEGKDRTYTTERGIVNHIEGKHADKLTEEAANTPLPQDETATEEAPLVGDDGVPKGMHID